MSKFMLTKVLAFAVVFSLLFAPLAYAQGPLSPPPAAAQAQPQGPVSPTSDSEISAPQTSHRLIVELTSPPAAVWSKNATSARTADDRLNLRAPSAQNYINQLQSEQAAFVSALRAALPSASVSTYLNENGQAVTADYQIVFNGMSIDPGANGRDSARKALLKLPGVKAVYPDTLYTTDLYTSTYLINAPSLWNNSAIGGRANAGAGIKVASMDGGVHKDAPMFSGAGFSYPPGYPAGGLGLTANNNGKIIASRAYFRSWDPPAPGDENPWPGENGTSHGVHTTGIAAGNIVDATYLGLEFPDMSGVAPAAWVMSYRVFYASANGNESFYTTEGIAALEDIVRDGADVLNNSWGEGPTSLGGEFDALDTALINAANAGIFISMSAGNAGPGSGTTDHPSDEYITVAASTTSGTLAAGVLNVTAPTPVPPTLKGLEFGTAAFGAPLPLATVLTYPFRAAANVNPANVEGCSAWPAGTFDGFAALIRRGTCDFSLKVYNAEQAGAEFVVIYNHAAGGDQITGMSCVTLCDQIHISSVFIGNTPGEAMVTWHAANGDASTLEVNTLAFQAGNTPDVIIDFSSRGPDTGNVFGPDIAAPGVNILSQGYTPGATGEARHLGYGQVSGTSMAAPHVAGAAALLRQIHPDWSNAYIKSALMSTAKYLDVYNFDGKPAQPLDMGAGRLDLAHASDPGVIFDPPSLGYGVIAADETKTITVTVTSVASATETYTLGLLDTRAGFPGASSLPGFSVTPASLTLEPGASATLTVTIDPALAGPGENQGYVILDGTTHDAHLPAWARVMAAVPPADVLVIDNDGSSSLAMPDYTSYYTSTLNALGYTSDVLDVDAAAGTVENFLPEATTLFGYKAILYFTGDNFYPNGSFTVPTPLTQIDMDRLTEYANHGGIILAMGQDLASVLGATGGDSFFYGPVLGGTWLQDSITSEITPTLPIIPLSTAPPAFNDLNIDVGATGDGAHNQLFMDEILATPPLVDVGDPNDPSELLPYTGLLRYPGPDRIEDGVVAVAHREQPTLERPGVSYLGRSVYTTFGLEGVNNNPGSTSRAELLQKFFNWAMDEPTVVISNTDQVETSKLAIFEVSLTSPISGTVGVSYRWDFGDGTPFTNEFPTQTASHTYEVCGPYTVRVEALDSYGNRTIGKLEVNITAGCTYRLLFPILFK